MSVGFVYSIYRFGLHTTSTMLPIVLVLLVATSAIAAPSVGINIQDVNSVQPERDNGNHINKFVTNGAFELLDGGDTNIYTLSLQQVLHDLAEQNDPQSQALAAAQTVATLGELGNGSHGDACDSAALVDAYANSVRTGNNAGLRQALGNYIARAQANIDNIVNLHSNPQGVRFAVGPRGNCNNGGRAYQFETAWNSVLATAAPHNSNLIYEQYCASKRLYSAFNHHSNNVGAAITAASLGPVTQIFRTALPHVGNFLRTVINGGNAYAAANAAKQALAQAAASIRL